MSTLDDTYEAAVAAWLALPPGAEAVKHYGERVFPLTCDRFRRLREGAEVLDLLYVPVGTQAYAPTLAVLANPARCVALLETDVSAPHGRQVEAELAAETGSVFLHVRVHDTSVGDIALAIRDVFDSRALPSGRLVGADVTGGKKAMTAAIAGVGSLYGWRLFYVDSQFERKHGFSHHERLVVLDNVLDVFGGRQREQALALLAAGACEAARRSFLHLASESAASAGDRRLAALAAAAGALRNGEPRRLGRHLGSAVRALGTPAPAAVLELVREAAEGPASVLEESLPSPARAALAWLGSRCAEGRPARRALREAADRLADPEGVEAAVAGRRRALAWLDRHLGRGLADRAEGLR